MDQQPRRRRRTRRFLLRYLRRRAEVRRNGSRLFVRPLRIVAGVALLAISPFVGAIPGPGGLLVFIPAVLLLASEIRRAALLLDHIENEAVPRYQMLRAGVRGRGPRPEWVAEEPEFWASWTAARGLPMPSDDEVDAARGHGYVSWSARERLRRMRSDMRERRQDRAEDRAERREERREERAERRDDRRRRGAARARRASEERGSTQQPADADDRSGEPRR